MTIYKKLTLLVDMDSIMVDMLETWITIYNHRTGENVDHRTLPTWDFRSAVKHPAILDEVLASKGFFIDLPLMPGCKEYFDKIIKNKDIETIVLTQPPRKSKYAAHEKREWLATNFPDFDLCNVIFAHKKHKVVGNVLFDDSPEHLVNWKDSMCGIVGAVEDPDIYTATIDYSYNLNVDVDFRFKNVNSAWEEFSGVIDKKML